MYDLQTLPDWVLFAAIGFIGGVCFQIYRGREDKGLPFSRLLANGVVAGFVSGIAGTYLQTRFPSFSHGIAGALGFASYPLLGWLEANGGRILSQRFGLGPAKDEKDDDDEETPKKRTLSLTDTQYVDLKDLLAQGKRLKDKMLEGSSDKPDKRD